MSRPGLSRFALCTALLALLGLFSSAHAQTQEDKWRQDLKSLVPPVVPLPPNSQLNPGSVGGTSSPYTTAHCRPRPRRRRRNRRLGCG